MPVPLSERRNGVRCTRSGHTAPVSCSKPRQVDTALVDQCRLPVTVTQSDFAERSPEPYAFTAVTVTL